MVATVFSRVSMGRLKKSSLTWGFMAGKRLGPSLLALGVLLAGCSSVADVPQTNGEASVVRPVTTAGPEGADLLNDVEGLVLPVGWPSGLPKPKFGSLQATSVSQLADGTPVTVPGPTDERWVLYAIPTGDLTAVVPPYRALLQQAGLGMSAAETIDVGIVQFDIATQPPVVARFSQTESGVMVVVGIKPGS